MESRDHLFFSCHFCSEVWQATAKNIYKTRFSTSWHSVVVAACSNWQDRKICYLARSVLQVTVYTLWHERNGRKHGEPPNPASRLIQRIDKQIRDQLIVIGLMGDRRYDDGLLIWCIWTNSHFILNMLEAFEPSLDLSKHMGKGKTGVLSIELQRMEGYDYSHKNHSADTRINNKTCEFDGSQLNHDHVSFSSHDLLDSSLQTHVPLVDVDKVRWVLRNIVRDWGAEGQTTRDECHKPILEELDSLFPDRQKESTPPACLVPGAGLGRLALEISCLGFRSVGNEFLYYMMICSSFILNYTKVPDEWTVYPWIYTNCNSHSEDDQLRPISIPEAGPSSVGVTKGFSMCCGDFLEVFNESSQAGMWDAVVTCFFIDTTRNIIEYIETISTVVKDGGVWINLEPLCYHFADILGLENEISIELSLEDVKRVASHYGFEIEKERTIDTTYCANPRSMQKNRYYSVFWTMRKKCAI
ncbi:PREDICTED: carnosine N-methyltransferase-like [Camelina sativa]|uniref:carnosine N-methyltransferase n=1 Tax=Camelina sativa TaxID=90675 RepID=A0ABM0T053_CAMSA|nr:PREDICTED: carnosine N-methyltransferase-like [Camelina sativa]